MLRNELLIFFPQREFWSGDEVKGYAELRLPFPMALSCVTLEFFGREFVEVNGKKEFSQFHHQSTQLEGPGSKRENAVKGLMSSLTSFVTGSKQVEPVPAGQHRYPFSFKIPDMTPPSYTTPNGGHIDYELRITVVAAGGKMSNLVSSARVPVAGSLFDMNLLGNSSTPFQVKENKSFLMARSTLDVTCNFESRVFLTGDPIKIKMDVVNNTGKFVTGMTVKLVQKIDLLGKAPKTDEYLLASQSIGDVEGKQEKHPIVELLVPTTACESVFWKEVAKNTFVGKIVQIQYFVKIHASVSLATDLDMMIPIFVVGRARHEQLIAQHQKQYPQLYQTQQPHTTVPYAPPVSDVFQDQQSQYYSQQQYYPQTQHMSQQQLSLPQYPPQPQQPQQQYQPQQTQQLPPPPIGYNPQHESYVSSDYMYPSTSFYPSVDDATSQPTQKTKSPTVLPPIPLSAYESAAKQQYEQQQNNQFSQQQQQEQYSMQSQPYDEFFE